MEIREIIIKFKLLTVNINSFKWTFDLQLVPVIFTINFPSVLMLHLFHVVKLN